jgi:hypothetical protein
VNVTLGMLVAFRWESMELRNHPRMSFRGQRNWPPEWIQTPTQNSDTATGEVGILQEIYRSVLDPSRCYLTIIHDQQNYIGVLRFDSSEFCKEISERLLRKISRPIAEIASSDISFTEKLDDEIRT